MMKYTIKLMGLLLAIILTTGLTSLTCLASNIEYEYYIEEGEAILTRCIDNETEVTVPCEIDGYKVRELKGTFRENTAIKKVVLEEGITLIGEEAFYGCKVLKKVEIADTVCRLDRYAFANSNMKVIKTVCTPSFYDNTFTTDCRFTDSDYMSYLYQSNWISPIVKLLQRSSPIHAAFWAMLVLGILVASIYFIRLILSLFGKDNIANYKKYSSRIFSEIDVPKDGSDIVRYKRIVFPVEKLIKIIKCISAGIFLFLYFVAVFHIIRIFPLDFEIENSFIRVVIKSVVAFFGSIFILVFIVWLLGKLRIFISDLKKEEDKPHIRIRRIRYEREENDK